MTSTSSRYLINRLKQRYFTSQLIEIIFISVGFGVIMYSVINFWTQDITVLLSLAVGAGLGCFISMYFKHRLHQINEALLIRFLNQRYPQLEQSADLLLRNAEDLGFLQQLQRAKVEDAFSKLYAEVRLPNHLLRSSIILIACVALSVVLTSFFSPVHFRQRDAQKHQEENSNIIEQRLPPSIQSAVVSIHPPAYTGLPEFQSKDLQVQLAEGSIVRWKLNFTHEVERAKIIFSGRDSAELKKEASSFVFSKKIEASGFYQIQWSDQGKIHRSDYFKIDVTFDQAPKVAITNLNQFTRLSFSDLQEIGVNSQLSDDYNLTQSHIIATVSKGSGESVKFREEKLQFEQPKVIGGKQVLAQVTLNLKKLGLEPGDELYFYVEAFDNKTPQPNRSRTETFFVALHDTTTQTGVDEEGLGVDLMPDYFRSQRQIIIDTEKLLKEKKKLAKAIFNSTSNELGFDQKTLRLKYGEFLGEEAESGIGIEAAHLPDADDKEEEDVTKKFGHQHDKENEHNLVQEKKDHDHEKEVNDPEAKEDPIAAFAHSHDNTEEATFFVQSVRAKLKAALTVMWDAELYLRLFQPEKSLPYQYTALKLLKEISNDSRIYVHRTGFDPPPLKEEKRLTADLSEVNPTDVLYQKENVNELVNIRAALQVVEKMIQQESYEVTAPIQATFTKAGQEFAALTLENPALLSGLSLLKSFSENRIVKSEKQKSAFALRAFLSRALPTAAAAPSQSLGAQHPLDQLFLKQLEEIKHE